MVKKVSNKKLRSMFRKNRQATLDYFEESGFDSSSIERRLSRYEASFESLMSGMKGRNVKVENIRESKPILTERVGVPLSRRRWEVKDRGQDVRRKISRRNLREEVAEGAAIGTILSAVCKAGESAICESLGLYGEAVAEEREGLKWVKFVTNSFSLPSLEEELDEIRGKIPILRVKKKLTDGILKEKPLQSISEFEESKRIIKENLGETNQKAEVKLRSFLALTNSQIDFAKYLIEENAAYLEGTIEKLDKTSEVLPESYGIKLYLQAMKDKDSVRRSEIAKDIGPGREDLLPDPLPQLQIMYFLKAEYPEGFKKILDDYSRMAKGGKETRREVRKAREGGVGGLGKKE